MSEIDEHADRLADAADELSELTRTVREFTASADRLEQVRGQLATSLATSEDAVRVVREAGAFVGQVGELGRAVEHTCGELRTAVRDLEGAAGELATTTRSFRELGPDALAAQQRKLVAGITLSSLVSLACLAVVLAGVFGTS